MPTDPISTGLAAFSLMREGRFGEVRDLFAPQLRPMVAPAALQAAWEAALAHHGPVTAVGTPNQSPLSSGVVAVRIPVTFGRGALTVVISLDADGRLGGLQLAPASAVEALAPWTPPDYADPPRFAEQEVTLGAGPLAVPGTLTLPQALAPCPAVVLLGGSGPGDRDGTLGGNKPLKDLAWGLASQGIAVLRFDKVTHAHRAALAGRRDFTLADEYVDHGVAAVRLLRQHPAVAPERVHLLGHSLGGTVAPRVAAAEPAVRGLVILAGGTQPLHWAMVRQLRYLAALNPATAPGGQAGIDAVIRQAQLVDSPELSAATPASALPFGVPAPYWLDLRGYRPAATAAALGRPLLILQGGRDYQVTVTDDLPAWRAALADRPDVTIRVYDRDNHLFFPGSGPSTPAEYEPPQHVDPDIVRDIAAWLTGPDPAQG